MMPVGPRMEFRGRAYRVVELVELDQEEVGAALALYDRELGEPGTALFLLRPEVAVGLVEALQGWLDRLGGISVADRGGGGG